MKIARKIAATAAVSILGFGALALTAPAAHANDTSWGCGGCRNTPPPSNP